MALQVQNPALIRTNAGVYGAGAVAGAAVLGVLALFESAPAELTAGQYVTRSAVYGAAWGVGVAGALHLGIKMGAIRCGC